MAENLFSSHPDDNEGIVLKGEFSETKKELKPLKPTTIKEAMDNREKGAT